MAMVWGGALLWLLSFAMMGRGGASRGVPPPGRGELGGVPEAGGGREKELGGPWDLRGVPDVGGSSDLGGSSQPGGVSEVGGGWEQGRGGVSDLGGVSPRGEVSEQELGGVSEQLLAADGARASPGDIVTRLQHRVSSPETGAGVDYAPQRLFSYVAEERLFSRPTFSRFLALLDNYEEATGHQETVTAQEMEEEEAFLDAIFQTPVMATLTSFFLAKGLYPSEETFRADLKQMWFGLYSRSGGKVLDSSGFEHVFRGELKKGKVSGGHNWVQLYLLERQGTLNYLSYSYNGPWTTFPDVLALQYRWGSYLKSVGSTFLGSSPEFDLALYTLCFKTRPDRQCHISLEGKEATIQTYSWTNSFYGDNQRFVASSYPLSP